MGQLVFLSTHSQDVFSIQSNYHLFAELFYIPHITSSIAYARECLSHLFTLRLYNSDEVTVNLSSIPLGDGENGEYSER